MGENRGHVKRFPATRDFFAPSNRTFRSDRVFFSRKTPVSETGCSSTEGRGTVSVSLLPAL